MITRILSAPKSAKDPLSYNEEKILLGKAEIIGGENVESLSIFSMRLAAKQLESNLAISAKTKNKAFHMAINPGVDDNMNDQEVCAYVDDLMRELDYEKQPYLIIKHHDIDRIHYHVVAVRIKMDGRVVRDSFSKREVMRIQKSSAEKYGFSVCYIDDNVQGLKPTPIINGMKHLVKQIRVNIMEAICFKHSDKTQFRAILRAFGIKYTQGVKVDKNGIGHNYDSFRGVDGEGNDLNRPVTAKKLFGVPLDEIYRTYHMPGQWPPCQATLTKIGIAYDNSKDIEEFKRRLNRVGISIFLHDKDGNEIKKTADLEGAEFVDMKAKQCLMLESTQLTLANIKHLLEESDRKRKEKEKPKEKPKEVVEKETSPAIQRKP